MAAVDSKPSTQEEKDIAAISSIIEEADIKSDFHVDIEVTLQSKAAKRLYKRVFDHMQTQATAAILLTRKFGLRESSDKNVTTIDAAFEQLQAEISKDIVFAERIIEDVGITTPATTSDEVTILAKITCPQGMALLQLIRSLDLLAVSLKTLMILGELPLSKSEDRVHAWQVRIFKSVDSVRKLGNLAYIEADKKRQSDAARNTARITKEKEKRAARKPKTNAPAKTEAKNNSGPPKEK